MDKINATKQQPQEDEEPLVIEERITKVNGDFYIKKHARGKFLGKGGFAKVYVFTNLETNKVVAGKVMPKANLTRSRSKQKLMVEIRLHKSLHHPNIVRFEHVFEDHENVYIMLELCQNQSVSELIKRRKRLTEFEVQCYVIQIVEALKYLQANRIIHRDLKLGNMFLNDKMQIKLGDFGLATKLEFEGEKKRTVCGTPNYLAPEVLDGAIGHSYQVDVWSLGVIIYTMLCGRPPFETKDIKMTYKRIKECNYAFPEGNPVSDTVKDLVAKILVVQPEKRLTLDEILLHPFINSGQPIPKLLPTSTMTTPPSAQYIKQFMLSSSSQRVRINTDAETLDANDLMKSARGLTISTARTATTSKVGSDFPTLDLLRNSNPQMNFEYVNTRFNTITGGLSNRNRQFVFPEKSPEIRKAPPTLENVELDTVTVLKSSRVDDYKSPLRKSETKDIITARDIRSANASISKQPTVARPITARESISKEPSKPVLAKEPMSKESLPKEPEMPHLNDIYVLKFYDYTSKYGLGYMLSNGMVGVSFNDGFKMIAINENEFEAITRRPSDKKDESKIYSFTDYPQELHKRILVHAKFREHFEPELKKIPIQHQKQLKQSIYIKKWIKTKQGVFFRLNNRTLHVAFKDGTLVLMNSNNKTLYFVDAKYKLHTCGIEGAAQNPNTDLSKRVKYIEEVLTRLWTVQTDTMQTQKTEMNENLVLETRRDMGASGLSNFSSVKFQPTMETLVTERY